MVISGAGRPLRGVLCALGTSTALGICCLAPGIALAQCDLNPTQANATTTCTGTDPNTLVANTSGSTVNIQAGASVASIYATTVSTGGAYFPSINSISITDNGQITGGLTVDSGTPPSYGFAPSTYVNLTVGANATIGGSTAISLIGESNGYQGQASLSLDNQGSIQSGSGPAVTSSGSGSASIQSLTNETGGSIGGISAVVVNLTNNGTIAGGAASAIDTTSTSTSGANSSMSWQNNGTISSNGAVPTINAVVGYQAFSLTNSGQISNNGSGAAINVASTNSYNASTITNNVGGTIVSSGGTAIIANGPLVVTNNGSISGNGYAIQNAGQLTLISTGAITGSVEADNINAGAGSTINLGGGGSITGSLTLGAFSGYYGSTGNTLIVDYSGGANLLSSISGTVTIGGTNNELVLNVPGSTTLSAPVSLPGAFSTLGWQFASGSTVTLGSGFTTTNGLNVSIASPFAGTAATLVNATTLNTVGAAVIENNPYAQVALVNTGTITANLNGAVLGTYAVNAELPNGGTALTNSGTITAVGGNGVYAYGSASNSGTISASGTALYVFDGVLTNSGSISGSTGINLTGYSGTNTGTISGSQFGANVSEATFTNSGNIYGNTGLTQFGGTVTNAGTISGVQAGVSLSSANFLNSGTIGASNGLGVALSYYNTLNNQQGGVINNGIGVSGSSGFSNVVSNAGTINGNVNLGGSSYGATSDNTYIALAGGMLNGNLNLGSGGDKLVVNLNAAGTYSGITGSVTGSGTETLVSIVSADTTTTLAAPSGVFSVFGYDLASGTNLTLTSATPVLGSYTFAGTGTVSLTADISGTGATTLLDLTVPSMQTAASGGIVPTALTFTSNGNLSVSASGQGSQPMQVVAVGAASTFTNNGTISYNNATTPSPYVYYYTPATAIYTLGTVTNNGTINIGGGAAILSAGYADTVVNNTGSILQIAGATDAIGIADATTVTNSGTIATGGTAIQFSSYYTSTLVNSGTITSTDGVAIGSDPGGYFNATARVTNAAGGVIGGGAGQAAIALGAGSAVVNSGTINGDVQLGVSGYSYGSGSTYVANGGTLNGNLTFGGSYNTLAFIGATGITGTISAGTGGNNTYAQGFTASAQIDLSALALPTGFQSYGAGAIGSGTVVTISGPASGFGSGLTVFGDGTVVNNANVNASTTQFGGNVVTLGGTLNGLLGIAGAVTFVNTGTLADGVQGIAQAFTNSGTIGSQQFDAGAYLTVAPQPTFLFDNSGQIWGSVSLQQESPTQQQPSATYQTLVTIQNSGNISGGIGGTLGTSALTLTNSGSVESIYLNVATPVGASVSSNDALVTATNTASGSVDGGVAIYVPAHNLAFSNAGQIEQYLNLGQSNSSAVDQVSASISNTGTISGNANLNFDSTNVVVSNAGAITTYTGSGYNYGYYTGGLALYNATVGSSTVAFTNSGSISNSLQGGSAAIISVNAGSIAAPASTAISVVNTGSITANGGGLYEPFFADQLITAGLGVSAVAPGGSAMVTITNAAGASITADGANNAGYSVYGIGTVPPAMANGGSVALIASAQTVNVINAGTITGGGDTVLSGPSLLVLVNGLITLSSNLAGAIDVMADNNASLTNTGTINGNTLLYAPTAAFANYGTVNGNVVLGTGAGVGTGVGTASAVEGIGATITGTVTGTAAVNTLTIDVTGGGVFSQALLSPFVGFQAPHLTGNGTIGFSGPLSLQTLVLDNASLTLAAGQVLQTAGPIALTGGIGTNSFTNYGTVNGAIVDVATTNGAGGVINVATTATSDATFTNLAGAQLTIGTGTYTIDGLVTNGGTITVDGGATFDAPAGIANNTGGLIHVLAGATVNDALVNAGTVVDNGVYNADIVNLAGGVFTATGPVTSPNSISNAGTFTVTGSTVSAPLFTNLAGGVLGGSLTFNTPGGTLLTNQGTIAGAITFGAGSNELLLGSGSRITGTVTGGPVANGTGSNLLAIASSARDTMPDQFSLAGVTGFQQSQLLSGSVALSGSYSTGSFAVLGGHLIGNAASVLNATTITVASGAAFGSAGVVNGNVVVGGTLAPVGTMTVNGNVALGTGSTALFAGDLPQLAVSGKVSIANGATLTLGSALSQRQGTLLRLISAGSGISGAFSATNLPAAYDLIETADLLEIYNPFIAGAGFGSAAKSALASINTLVVSGQANAALVTDLAVLSNAQGVADAGRFARLTPEPYATAMQIGLDNGLEITDALRDFDYEAVESPAKAPRLFSFVEGMGNRTHAGGNLATGSSGATNATGGLFGGLGWRGDHAMVSAFAGGIHGQQTIAALGAQTLAHSTLFGANALAWVRGIDLSASVAWDNGIGDTTRALPDGTSAWSRYGLRAMVADIALGYTIRDPSGWTMRPQIGLTHVATHRDASSELGSTAFQLDVAGARRKRDFIDGSWRIAPPSTATTRFAPWVSLGFRTMLGTDNPRAFATLPDATDAIEAAGVLRAKTVVTVKTGFAYALSPGAAITAAFDGERGNGANNRSVNGGIRLAF